MNKEENNTNKCPICERPTHKYSKYCIFHAGVEEKTEDEFKERLKEYLNKIKEEDGDYNFKKFIFVGDIYFNIDLDITIFKNANLNGAIFKGNATFLISFEGDASFTGATFEGDASFTGATFKRNADFWSATFGGDASFTGATFEGDASFTGATFGEDASFITFKGYASFYGTTFKRNADFWSATFKGDANFRGATFKRNANFERTTFEGDADFTGTTFEGDASLYGVTFKGNADFVRTTFKGDAFFESTTFEGDADFGLKYLIEMIDFSEIKIFPGKKLFIKINNEGVKISFKRAYLENIDLEIELAKDILIDFTGVLLKNTKIKKGQIENHILQEEEKDYLEAKEICLLLKNNFHSIGKYEDESWAFTKERDMEKFSYKFINSEEKHKYQDASWKKNLFNKCILNIKFYMKWLFSKKSLDLLLLKMSSFVYGYGENPWRVIRFAFIIIFLFAIFLNFSGIINSDRTNLIIEFIKESQGDRYTLKYLGPILGSFLNCLYFSVVTFTTLGYGDFQPAVGLSRFFVSLESIIGAITMALFVYTFARRTGGR